MIRQGKSRFFEQAINSLLAANSIEQAAKSAGISKRTLLRWMADEEFRAKYAEAKADVLKMATAILTRNSGKAAKVLGDVFSGKPVAHQGARVAACSATIRLALDAFALENLENRIRKLEQQSDVL